MAFFFRFIKPKIICGFEFMRSYVVTIQNLSRKRTKKNNLFTQSTTFHKLHFKMTNTMNLSISSSFIYLFIFQNQSNSTTNRFIIWLKITKKKRNKLKMCSTWCRVPKLKNWSSCGAALAVHFWAYGRQYGVFLIQIKKNTKKINFFSEWHIKCEIPL